MILKSPEGAWTTIGTEESRGIIAEGITVTANEFGPDTCSFSLRREASVPYPDLLAYNQADVLIGGTLLWGGRVWEAPLSDADEDVIAVQGRGWQYHLDDDLLQRLYVHTRMGDYVDQRTIATADLTVHKQGPTTQSAGSIVIAFPNQYPVTTGQQVCVTFDAGFACLWRAVVNWTRVGVSDVDDTIYSKATDIEDATAAVSDASGSTLSGASGTISHTFTAARRYHHLFIYRNGVGATFGADQGARITSVTLFGSASYESGGASILKASDVVKDLIAATENWLLDRSTALVTNTSFSIPDLSLPGYQTMRSIINAANAYEGNLYGVDAERRVFYRERSDYPDVEVGAWPGSSFQDASTNSGDGIYNRVLVQGTGPDGAPVQGVALASPSNPISRQGSRRSAVLAVDSPISTSNANTLAGIWILERENSSLKGSLVVSQGGARYLNGGEVHPSELMLRYGQKIRLGQLVDPTTGDQGRDGIIKSVSYQHDTETATLELDSERGRLETLLSRLSVVTSQIR